MEEAVIPLPRPDAIPPVTTMYFIAPRHAEPGRARFEDSPEALPLPPLNPIPPQPFPVRFIVFFEILKWFTS